MNENPKDLFARLAAPFYPQDIEWRAGATNADKTKAMALAYITSRAVMDRLDEVMGPQNWKDEYAPGPDGGVICGLSLRVDGEWVTKWDGAENTDFEAVKGGLSDAFKRAGYKWGVGRYLYRLENVWVACEAHGKSISLKSTPNLPAWALPNEWVDASGKPAPKATSRPTANRENEILAALGYSEKPAAEPVPVSVAAPGGNGKNDAAKAAMTAAAPAGSNGGNSSRIQWTDSSSRLNKPDITPPPSKPDPKSSPNFGKRPISWSSAVVQAVMNSKLASTTVECVRLLNETGLAANATPEEAIAAVRALSNK